MVKISLKLSGFFKTQFPLRIGMEIYIKFGSYT